MPEEHKNFRPWIMGVAFLIAVLAATGLWMLGNYVRIPPGQVQSHGEAEIGGPFTLTDQYGERRSSENFRGRLMLIYFGFTNCPDVCPTTLAMISEVLKILGPKGDSIVPIFITVDPERDTPQVLKSYLQSFNPRFIGLTGTAQEISATAKSFRVYYQMHESEGGGHTMDHSNFIYLMDRAGKLAGYFSEQQGAEPIAAEINKKL